MWGVGGWRGEEIKDSKNQKNQRTLARHKQMSEQPIKSKGNVPSFFWTTWVWSCTSSSFLHQSLNLRTNLHPSQTETIKFNHHIQREIHPSQREIHPSQTETIHHRQKLSSSSITDRNYPSQTETIKFIHHRQKFIHHTHRQKLSSSFITARNYQVHPSQPEIHPSQPETIKFIYHRQKLSSSSITDRNYQVHPSQLIHHR